MHRIPLPIRRSARAACIAALVAAASLAGCAKTADPTGGGGTTTTTTAPAAGTTGTTKSTGTSAPKGTTTVPKPGTTKPTTTTPPNARTLILRGDGLGVTDIGDEERVTMRALTGVLGDPTEETDWFEGGLLPYPTKSATWGPLNVMFAEHEGFRHFAGWFYSNQIGVWGREPLATESGVALDQTYADLRDLVGGGLFEEGFEGATGMCWDDNAGHICALFEPPYQLPGQLTDRSVIAGLQAGDHA